MKAIPVKICFDCDDDPGWACDCREYKDGQYVPGKDCPLPDVPEPKVLSLLSKIQGEEVRAFDPQECVEFVAKLRGMK